MKFKKNVGILLLLFAILLGACGNNSQQETPVDENSMVTVKFMDVGLENGYIGIDHYSPEVVKEVNNIISTLENEETVSGVEQVESVRLFLNNTELEIDIFSLYSDDTEQKVHLRLWSEEEDKKEQKEYLLDKENETSAKIKEVLEKILSESNTTPQEMIDAMEELKTIKN